MTVLEMSLRQSKLIYCAFMAGAGSFGIVVLFIVQGGHMPRPAPGGNFEVLAYVVPAVAAAGFLAMLLIRAVIARKTAAVVAQTREEEVIAAVIAESFLRVSVLTGVLLEGPALLSTVAALVTGHLEFLAATTAGLVALAFMFPTKRLLEGWARRVSGPGT